MQTQNYQVNSLYSSLTQNICLDVEGGCINCLECTLYDVFLQHKQEGAMINTFYPTSEYTH